MNLYVIVGSIFGLQLICFFYALSISSKETTRDGYFLASRKLRFFPLMMTFVATLIGGGSTLGAAEEAYTHGFIIFLYPIGGTVGLILVALFLGKKLQKLKITTMAQILEKAYQSSLLRKLASLLSILALFSIFVAQIVATRKFLLSLGISSDLTLIGFWLIVSLYTAWGGLKAVAYTDVIQGLFFISVLTISFLYTKDSLQLNILDHLFFHQDYDIQKYVSWLLMPMLFMLMEQDMALRILGAKNAKTIRSSALFAAFLSLIITFVPICFGASARFANLNMPLGSSVLICTISNSMHPILASFVGSSIMAAIVSTADSQLNAISSNIACDFFKKLSMTQIRLVTLAVACGAIFCSYFFDNVIDVIMIFFEVYVTAFFIPMLLAIYSKNISKKAAYVSTFLGMFSFIFLKFQPIAPIPSSLIALGISFLGFKLTQEITCDVIRPIQK
jgi:SSS family solute:Na+ symporter